MVRREESLDSSAATGDALEEGAAMGDVLEEEDGRLLLFRLLICCTGSPDLELS